MNDRTPCSKSVFRYKKMLQNFNRGLRLLGNVLNNYLMKIEVRKKGKESPKSEMHASAILELIFISSI